jgi:hypothetical protein
MNVKWGSLGEVFVVSFGVTIAVVVVFSLGILATSARRNQQTAALGTTAAAACFAVCAGIVAYGLYLIIPQFHK